MILDILLVLTGLAVLLAASELMVRSLTTLGSTLGLSGASLGLLVALGADAPEISTGLAALVGGSASLGVGVLEGSNIFNLAALLGLSTMFAAPLVLSRRQLVLEGVPNVAAALLAAAVILASALPGLRVVLALGLFVCLPISVWSASRTHTLNDGNGALIRPAVIAGLSVVAIVGAAILVVYGSSRIVAETAIPIATMSVLVLPISTSIPNVWAAISLARQGEAEAVIATTFGSNLINLAVGVALPSLFVALAPEHSARVFDGPYLVAMSLLTVVILLTRRRLGRVEGQTVIGMYILFLLLRFAVFP